MKRGFLTAKSMRRWSMWIAIAAMAVFLLASIVNVTTSNSYHKRLRDTEEQRKQSMQEIIHRLEFEGLDDTAKLWMENFNNTYTDFSNFILVDNNFKVLYHLNQGYLSNEESFYALLSDAYYQLVVCDAQGNVTSRHSLDTSDARSLQQLTRTYPAKTGNTMPEGIFANDESSSYIPNGDGRFTIDSYGSNGSYNVISVEDSDYYGAISSDNAFFAPIGSKGMYLFYLYNQNSPKWNGGLVNYYDSTYYKLNNTLVIIMVITFLLYWIALPVFVFLDARQRDNHPALWGVLTLLTNVVGLVVYLAVRPSIHRCGNCQEVLEDDYAYCPMCGARNRGKCPGCGALVEDAWSHCPHCGKEIHAPDLAAAESGPAT